MTLLRSMDDHCFTKQLERNPTSTVKDIHPAAWNCAFQSSDCRSIVISEAGGRTTRKNHRMHVVLRDPSAMLCPKNQQFQPCNPRPPVTTCESSLATRITMGGTLAVAVKMEGSQAAAGHTNLVPMFNSSQHSVDAGIYVYYANIFAN